MQAEPAQRLKLFGFKATNINRLERTFGVGIMVPKDPTQAIRLKGPPGKINAAVEHLKTEYGAWQV